MIEYEIEDLVPQCEPFLMVGKLLSYSEERFKTSFRIPEDNYFSIHGFFEAEGLIENMAQSAAAGSGYALLKNGTKKQMGYIGAIKNVEIHKRPKVNETIFTTVKVTGRVLNVDIVECKVVDDQKMILATCEMKIFAD